MDKAVAPLINYTTSVIEAGSPAATMLPLVGVCASATTAPPLPPVPPSSPWRFQPSRICDLTPFPASPIASSLHNVRRPDAISTGELHSLAAINTDSKPHKTQSDRVRGTQQPHNRPNPGRAAPQNRALNITGASGVSWLARALRSSSDSTVWPPARVTSAER